MLQRLLPKMLINIWDLMTPEQRENSSLQWKKTVIRIEKIDGICTVVENPFSKRITYVLRGEKLAEHIVDYDFKKIILNAEHISPEFLISSFYYDFLNKVIKIKPNILDDIKNIEWTFKHNFQKDYCTDIINRFIDDLTIKGI